MLKIFCFKNFLKDAYSAKNIGQAISWYNDFELTKSGQQPAQQKFYSSNQNQWRPKPERFWYRFDKFLKPVQH